MRILETIHTAPWALHPQAAYSYLPLVIAAMNGNMSGFKDMNAQAKQLVSFAASDFSTADSPNDNDSSVAIYNVEGVITKADQYCGPQGTISMMRQSLANDRNPSVCGHLFAFSSGGGEATNIVEVMGHMRSQLKKPVVGWFDMAASAAYGMISACDEIYANLPTNITGSVGAMMTLQDWKQFFKDKGIVIHEIYADPSKQKNAEHAAAMQGDYEPIKRILLNPIAESFVDAVRAMRPQIKDENVFEAVTVNAKDALEAGMIDGFKSYNEAIARVFELSRKQNNSKFKNKKSSMEIKVFGKTILATKSEDGSVTMTAEQYGILEAASITANANSETITALNQKVEGLEGKMETIDKAVAKLQGWADATPAATPASAQATPPAAEKPWESFNKKVQSKLESNQSIIG